MSMNKQGRSLQDSLQSLSGMLKTNQPGPNNTSSNKGEAKMKEFTQHEVEIDEESEMEAADLDQAIAQEIADIAAAEEHEEQDEEDEEEMEVSAFKAEQEMQIVPFSGLFKQNLTVVVDVNGELQKENESSEFNFQNPFSKKGGVVREYVTAVLPFMQAIAQKELLVITDNFVDSVGAIRTLFAKNAQKHLEAMFPKVGGLDVSIELQEVAQDKDDDYPTMLMTTTINTAFPLLSAAKSDVIVRNLLLYWNKLIEDTQQIQFRMIVGFTTLGIIEDDTRPVFDDFMQRSIAKEFKMVHQKNKDWLSTVQIDSDQADALFSQFDVLFVSQ